MDVQALKNLIEPLALDQGLVLVDLFWRQEGKTKCLTIHLDGKTSPFDLQAAETITPLISDLLDEQTDMNFDYLLDISSPGAEREVPASDWKTIVGRYVCIKFTNPNQYGDQVMGILDQVDMDSLILVIRIKTREKKITIKKSEIAMLRLAVKI